ncbi:DL-endopeptidase inhibitor IseA family protein [Paenibacillus sp. EPM92]|uniref:DL-endopeptidase inhibitor IseA family protein n=1 Tax=Paenibacillus sp. EPM92 TaxID=1561195 RepID=UPI00191665B1|nr:DL-endopeptidase inhibitor IseA family protein [Paenibacillus sp. EPM92]
MKMSWKSFVSGMVLGSVLFSGISYAAPKVVKLVVNGNDIHSEVAPQIIDGSTMIPARALAEALGARVFWDEDNQTVVVENEEYRRLQRKQADISERDAAGLAADAQHHFWQMMIGGGGDHKDGSFDVKGNDYRWMGTELDTKTKYIEYLELLYTPEQAQAYWKQQTENGSIVEIEGKLAQPNADGGSRMEWENAQATFIQEGNGVKTFRFSVPIEDSFEVKEIKLRFVEGKGWRIDEPVDTIR